jgi:N-acetylmuramate 1-kinase
MRQELILNFLKEQNLEKYKIEELQKDASSRNYLRIKKDKQSYIVMDCPEDDGAIENFIKISKILAKNSLSIPKILHQNLKDRILIIEDFGNDILTKYLENHPYQEQEIYSLAIDNIIRITGIKEIEQLKPHSKDVLLEALRDFAQYYLNIDFAVIKVELEKIFNQLDFKHKYLCLRDFHADNLFYLSNRQSYNKIALIDYQDACQGFISYDLVSLIEDARRFIPYEERIKYLNYFIQNKKDIDREYLSLEFSILSLQRNARILGLFNKFAKKDNNKNYLKYIGNVEDYFYKNLENPIFKDFKSIIQK